MTVSLAGKPCRGKGKEAKNLAGRAGPVGAKPTVQHYPPLGRGLLKPHSRKELIRQSIHQASIWSFVYVILENLDKYLEMGVSVIYCHKINYPTTTTKMY